MFGFIGLFLAMFESAASEQPVIIILD